MVVIVVALSVYSYNITNQYNILVENNKETLQEYGFAMDMLNGFMFDGESTKKQIQKIEQNPLGTI